MPNSAEKQKTESDSHLAKIQNRAQNVHYVLLIPAALLADAMSLDNPRLATRSMSRGFLARVLSWSDGVGYALVLLIWFVFVVLGFLADVYDALISVTACISVPVAEFTC